MESIETFLLSAASRDVMVAETLVEIAPKDEVKEEELARCKLQFRCLLSAYISSPEPRGSGRREWDLSYVQRALSKRMSYQAKGPQKKEALRNVSP